MHTTDAINSFEHLFEKFRRNPVHHKPETSINPVFLLDDFCNNPENCRPVFLNRVFDREALLKVANFMFFSPYPKPGEHAPSLRECLASKEALTTMTANMSAKDKESYLKEKFQQIPKSNIGIANPEVHRFAAIWSAKNMRSPTDIYYLTRNPNSHTFTLYKRQKDGSGIPCTSLPEEFEIVDEHITPLLDASYQRIPNRAGKRICLDFVEQIDGTVSVHRAVKSAHAVMSHVLAGKTAGTLTISLTNNNLQEIEVIEAGNSSGLWQIPAPIFIDTTQAFKNIPNFLFYVDKNDLLFQDNTTSHHYAETCSLSRSENSKNYHRGSLDNCRIFPTTTSCSFFKPRRASCGIIEQRGDAIKPL